MARLVIEDDKILRAIQAILDPDAPDYEAIVHGLRLPDERQA